MNRNYLDTFSLSKRFASVEAKTVDYCPSPDADCFSNEQTNTLIVLSWNVNKNNQSERWAEEFSDIYTRYQPDIICLQEACLSTTSEGAKQSDAVDSSLAWSKPLQKFSSLGSLERMSWCFAPNFEDTIEGMYSGVLTISTMPSIGSRGLLTGETEPITQTPKVSLLTEYDLTGYDLSERSLLVINTHLINFVRPLVFQTQLDQIEAAAIAHKGAILLAGDFNTWSQDRLKRLKKTVAQLGLSPAQFAPQAAQYIKRFLMSPPLDHIFYRGFQQNLLGAAVISPVYASDHRPLVIELRY